MLDSLKDSLRDYVEELVRAFSGALSFEWDPQRPEQEQVERAIGDAALVAGVVSCFQPIPAADVVLLMPLHVKLALHIGKIKGFEVTPERAREIVRDVLGVAGLALTSQALIGAVGKLLPWLRPVLTYPLNYAATWAIGHSVAYVFDCLRADEPVSAERLRQVFQEQLDWGRRRGRALDPRSIEGQAELLRQKIAARDPSLVTETRLTPRTAFAERLRPEAPRGAPRTTGRIKIVIAPPRPKVELRAKAPDFVAELERLAELHAKGELDDEGFRAAKQLLLD